MWRVKIFHVLRPRGFIKSGKVTDTVTHALFAENTILQKLINKILSSNCIFCQEGEIHQRTCSYEACLMIVNWLHNNLTTHDRNLDYT